MICLERPTKVVVSTVSMILLFYMLCLAFICICQSFVSSVSNLISSYKNILIIHLKYLRRYFMKSLNVIFYLNWFLSVQSPVCEYGTSNICSLRQLDMGGIVARRIEILPFPVTERRLQWAVSDTRSTSKRRADQLRINIWDITFVERD